MTVRDHPIVIGQVNGAAYINISQLAAAGTKEGEDPSQAVATWLRGSDTMKYLAAWEKLYGAKESFSDEALWEHLGDITRKSFSMSAERWVKTTNAVGIEVRRGRSGGVFAHEDIALEFCTWLDPVFKLYVLKEFQRLKEAEQKALDPEWTVRRVLAANNWRIQTDAVRDYELPRRNMPQNLEGIVYADEAETLNLALFHITSKQWRLENPTLTLQNRNLRDYATLNELIVLSNLEALNAELLKEGYPREKRIDFLARVAQEQLESLSKVDVRKSMNAAQQRAQRQQLPAPEQPSSFDASLQGLMAIPPPPKPVKKGKQGHDTPPKYNDPE